MRGAAALAVWVCAPALGVVAWSAQDPSYRVERVRPDVAVLRGPGPNVVVLDRGGARLVVDSAPAARGDGLRAALESIGRRPVRFLVNTHHHRETTGGNASIAAEDTIVIAHENADRRMRSAGGSGASMRFRSRLTLECGGETVTCHHKGAGHTDGDTVVHFEGANVLVVGGLVANGAHPAFVRDDGADLRGWIRVLVELERDFRGSGVVVVPADGAPGGVELLAEQVEYLRAILDLMEDAQRRGMSREEALREAERLRERFGGLKGEHLERLLDAGYEAAGR